MQGRLGRPRQVKQFSNALPEFSRRLEKCLGHAGHLGEIFAGQSSETRLLERSGMVGKILGRAGGCWSIQHARIG